MIKSAFSKKQLREFGFLFGLGFPIIIGWILPGIIGHLFRSWTLWVGVPFFFLAILKPDLLLYPYKLWMELGHALGWINSRIVFGLIFILVLLPISFIMRFFGYDPLKKMKNNQNSYREIKQKHKVDLTRIF